MDFLGLLTDCFGFPALTNGRSANAEMFGRMFRDQYPHCVSRNLKRLDQRSGHSSDSLTLLFHAATFQQVHFQNWHGALLLLSFIR